MATFLPTTLRSGRSWGGLPSIFDLHREVNRLFDDLLADGGGVASSVGAREGALAPALDIQDKEDEVCIRADMPGVAPSELDVRLDGDVLTLTGERRVEREDEKYHVKERSVGRFQRSVRLPFAPDPDKVVASADKGVVTIRVPRTAPQGRSRRIEVRSGADDGAQPAPQVGTSNTSSSSDGAQKAAAAGSPGAAAPEDVTSGATDAA